ncbi:unnamed protein product [Phytophthora fragariaefolia]|uniref:Unnamed protein product n=1 Tax=Phytophthora fragariaefolia TaxID=1490495 RepID=A0A9W6WWQ9_9STRA|nr:unnamed protein product [Phytophthora fragariaefolia]
MMKQRTSSSSSSSSSADATKPQLEDVSKPLLGSSRTTRRLAYALALAMLLVTFYSFPVHRHFHGRGGKNARYVWWCGWLTAIATGLGALPFYWIRDLDKYWLGICNGLAAGMMIAATGCLFYEGWHLPQAADYAVSVSYRLLLGAFLGVLFIKFTKVFLEDYEDVSVCGLKGLDARKALLIMAVMTLHSVSEGIGVGVSFGGEGGIRRGHIVTMTMAIHNIPEGVAISLSLVPRGLSVFYAVLWCIMSSAPQPIFAVPAFLFVEQWLPILPCGLGFAGGAMAYVAVQELLPESLEDTKSVPTTVSATAFAFMVFLTIQIALSGSLARSATPGTSPARENPSPKKPSQGMKLSTLMLALVSLSRLGGSAANDASDIMRRQLRVGKAVASLFENQHQSVRELQESILQDEDKSEDVQVEPTKFRMRRLVSPNYVELIE